MLVEEWLALDSIGLNWLDSRHSSRVSYVWIATKMTDRLFTFAVELAFYLNLTNDCIHTFCNFGTFKLQNLIRLCL